MQPKAIGHILLASGLLACSNPSPDEPDAAVAMDSTAAAACPVPSGEGTSHSGTVETDETWTAEASPHIVTFDLSVRAATVTVEPCAVVRIQDGYHISIGGSTGAAEAAFVAHGEVDTDGTRRPVRIEADTPGSHWGSFRVFPTGRLDLEVVEISNGGEHDTAQNGGGTIVALGDGGPELVRSVRVVDVEIANSEGFGVNLQSFAAFTQDSARLEITTSGAGESGATPPPVYPVKVSPPAIHSLPEGSYTGNGVDEILIFNEGSIDADETFHDRGVPYRLWTELAMRPAAASNSITLTIDPGVVIRTRNADANNWGINLGSSNGPLPENIWPVRLVADGTADKPIVFTSASDSPAAGDWVGIEWAGGPPDGNVMRHVRIEYAGADSGTSGFGCGPSDNDAAVIITNWKPDDAFMQDVTISDSAGGGIVCGWATDGDSPDLKGGNTFTNVANGCAVARWQDETPPVCPSDGAMPDCL